MQTRSKGAPRQIARNIPYQCIPDPPSTITGERAVSLFPRASPPLGQ